MLKIFLILSTNLNLLYLKHTHRNHHYNSNNTELHQTEGIQHLGKYYN